MFILYLLRYMRYLSMPIRVSTLVSSNTSLPHLNITTGTIVKTQNITDIILPPSFLLLIWCLALIIYLIKNGLLELVCMKPLIQKVLLNNPFIRSPKVRSIPIWIWKNEVRGNTINYKIPSLPVGHLSQRERKEILQLSPFGRDGVARDGMNFNLPQFDY